MWLFYAKEEQKKAKIYIHGTPSLTGSSAMSSSGSLKWLWSNTCQAARAACKACRAGSELQQPWVLAASQPTLSLRPNRTAGPLSSCVRRAQHSRRERRPQRKGEQKRTGSSCCSACATAPPRLSARARCGRPLAPLARSPSSPSCSPFTACSSLQGGNKVGGGRRIWMLAAVEEAWAT